MLVGHYAPAFALRRLAPETPLWALFVAAQAVDIGFFLLAFGGIEGARLTAEAPRLVVTDGLWTHSLVASVVWALAGAGLAAGRWGRRAGLAVGVAVLSHWFADVIMHTPDMPVTWDPASAVGLSLWMFPPWDYVFELGLLVLSWVWLRASVEGRRRRAVDLCGGFLVILGTLAAFVIPTPPNIIAMGLSGLAVYAGAALVARRVGNSEEIKG